LKRPLAGNRENSFEVPAVHDQDAVEALAACGADQRLTNASRVFDMIMFHALVRLARLTAERHKRSTRHGLVMRRAPGRVCRSLGCP